MGDVHHARYKSPTGLKAEDAKMRRAARLALAALQDTFFTYGLATSKSDAEQLAHNISLLANLTSDCRKLIRLSTFLQSLLLSALFKEDRIYVANACLDFERHCDIDRLLAELQTVQKRV
jgi:hypothetical protein